MNFISRRKFDDLRDHRWHLFENFAMKVVEFQFCDVFVTFAGRTRDTNLEVSAV